MFGITFEKKMSKSLFIKKVVTPEIVDKIYGIIVNIEDYKIYGMMLEKRSKNVCGISRVSLFASCQNVKCEVPGALEFFVTLSLGSSFRV